MISRRAKYVIAAFVAIVLLSMLVTRPSLVPPAVARMAPNALVRSTPDIAKRSFLLLKTGAEVAHNRLPPHIDTTLRRWPHSAVYADTNATISKVQVIDCLSFLPDITLNSPEMEGYRVRRQMQDQRWNWGDSRVYINSKSTGWELDRFKNIPAFAEAWAQSHSYDWYVMIDADSYLAAYTLDQVTEGHNPDEPIYFGKAVGYNPRFAHGGSGIVLSRGTMRMLFGEHNELLQQRLVEMDGIARPECCGDSVVARMYMQATGRETVDTLQQTEFGQFQGNRISTTIVKFDHEFCNSVGSFHGVQPWENYVLDAWERRCEDAKQPMRYADFYAEFVMPHVQPEIEFWEVVEGPGEIDSRKWESHDIESQVKSRCIDACSADEECTMWTYKGGEKCINYRNLVILGEAINRYSGNWNDEWTGVATGYMVDRIRARRAAQACDGLRIESDDPHRREGSFLEQLRRDNRDSQGIMSYSQVRLVPDLSD